MSLFNHLQEVPVSSKDKKRNTLPPTEVDVGFAKQLSTALWKRGKLRRASYGAKWAEQFRILRESQPTDIVANVLNWYCLHIGERYIPRAYSAKTFRLRFAAIKEAMERADPQSHLTISEEAKALQKRLRLRWPRDAKQHELALIQLCMDNYSSFRSNLKQLTPTLPEHLQRLVPFVTRKMGGVALFVEWWIRDMNDLVWDWEERSSWYGSWQGLIFKPDHPRFHSKCVEWTHSFCNDWNRWTKLMEQYNENFQTQ